MKTNYKSLFGFTVVVGVVLLANIYHAATIRGQYLADRQFHVLAIAVAAEARAQLAEKTHAGGQTVINAGWSEMVGHGKAELSYHWEIGSKSASVDNLDLQSIAQTISAKLQEMTSDEALALHYYYPNARINVETSVVNSKFFNKPAVLVYLNCNS